MEKIQTGLLNIDTKVLTYDNIQVNKGSIKSTIRDAVIPVWYTQWYEFQFQIDSLTGCQNNSYYLKLSNLKTYATCLN